MYTIVHKEINQDGIITTTPIGYIADEDVVAFNNKYVPTFQEWFETHDPTTEYMVSYVASDEYTGSDLSEITDFDNPEGV